MFYDKNKQKNTASNVEAVKNVKIDLASALAIKKTIEKEAENLSEEQESLIKNIHELNEIIQDLEFVKTVGLDTRVKEYEEKLKRFEGLIDNKYRNEEALFCIGLLIASNCAQNLEEAIAGYEEYKKTE